MIENRIKEIHKSMRRLVNYNNENEENIIK